MSARNLVSYASLLGFVQQHPAEAAEFLLGCLPEKRDDLASVIFHANQQAKNPAIDATVEGAPYYNNSRDVPVRSGPGDSHRPGSSSGARKSVHDFQTSRTRLPPSPTRTTSSHSRSTTSKEGRENIVILATDEQGDVQEYAARMRTAQIEYSVIGEHMFQDGRICEDHVIAITEQRLAVPIRNSPGASKDVVVSSAAKLTWVRPRSSASHSTTFYLVPSENVDIDVLLGCHDSGEEFLGSIPSPPQRPRGFSFIEPTMNASAKQAPQPSFHRSSQLPGSSLDEKPDAIIQAMLNLQRERVLDEGETTLPQHSPASTRHKSAQCLSHNEQTNSRTPTVVPKTHEPRTDKIRLTCKLGSLSFQCWLYLDAPGEAFCENVQNEFKKRKLQFDRPNSTILFKNNKEAPDIDAYYLSLDEDALEADWGETIDWLRTNKRNVSPHIYGTIQIDDG
ncbi:hypothetical protein BDU57DRAFT_512432 [Ampelomyces quisqualis]|uniref:Uncharacterized protein n=1 Tax=Ampelomyces quisqualis TaxID=50730 RepID=A0A6A5QUA3_AMPQU|nr:hypothetical protein BDU57DRAFT_512432 [Ampelomyces quisqualis]